MCAIASVCIAYFFSSTAVSLCTVVLCLYFVLFFCSYIFVESNNENNNNTTTNWTTKKIWKKKTIKALYNDPSTESSRSWDSVFYFFFFIYFFLNLFIEITILNAVFISISECGFFVGGTNGRQEEKNNLKGGVNKSGCYFRISVFH